MKVIIKTNCLALIITAYISVTYSDHYVIEKSIFNLYLNAKVSFVISIKKTVQTTNQQRPCTTTQTIKKELSICQSFACPNLVSFHVLGRIKPQVPRLVYPSVNFFKFQSCDHTPP